MKRIFIYTLLALSTLSTYSCSKSDSNPNNIVDPEEKPANRYVTIHSEVLYRDPSSNIYKGYELQVSNSSDKWIACKIIYNYVEFYKMGEVVKKYNQIGRTIYLPPKSNDKYRIELVNIPFDEVKYQSREIRANYK